MDVGRRIRRRQGVRRRQCKAGGEWVDTAMAGGENARAADDQPHRRRQSADRHAVQHRQAVRRSRRPGPAAADLDASPSAGRMERHHAAGLARRRDAATARSMPLPVNIHGQNWLCYSKRGASRRPASPSRRRPGTTSSRRCDKLKDAGIIPLALGGQPWQERVAVQRRAVSAGRQGPLLQGLSRQGPRGDPLARVQEGRRDLRQAARLVDAGRRAATGTTPPPWSSPDKAGIQFMGDWVKGEFIAAGQTAGQGYGCILGLGEQRLR